MFNTIILLEGTANLTDEELKKFEEGDTIYGNNSNPVEITRWSVPEQIQASAELAKYRCSYNGGHIKEYALKFCECNKDGEYVSGTFVYYDFAFKEGRVVTVGVYADTVYSDWWDEPDKYGDDNTAILKINESDLIEWYESYGGKCFKTFMEIYTHDDTNDLYEWLKENGRYVEVVQ